MDDIPETYRLSELEVKLLDALQLFTARADRISEIQDVMAKARRDVLQRKQSLTRRPQPHES